MQVTPNIFAWLVLGCWPLLVLAVYAARRSGSRPARTTAWMMILPAMFLPAQLVFKVQGIPEVDKHRLSFLSIALALQLFHRRDLLARAPAPRFPRLVLLALVIGAIGTVQTNGDPLRYGWRVVPALGWYDAMSIAASMFLDVYLPFAIGARVFRTERDLRDLFEVLTLCGLIYAPLCLFELRFAPQLHYRLYGYYQHQFLQMMRGDGYRPLVFMSHGLAVAMFYFSCLVASLGLLRARAEVHPSARVRTTCAAALVLLCKSLGAIIYSLFAVLFQPLLPTKALSRVVLGLAVVVLAYPVIRASNLLPTRDVVEFFRGISTERADSLAFRFRNEDALLAHAMERPVFGWGIFARNRVFSRWGDDESIIDGQWIILLGSFGYVGFLGFFALMVVPLLRFFRFRPRMPGTSQILAGALAVVVVVFALDLLPNSASDYQPLAYAGALFTLAANLRQPVAARRRIAQTARSPLPVKS